MGDAKALQIKGIIPPLVTPLQAENELDKEGLNRLIEHVLKGGVHGIFILGTTGEAPSLSYQLRRELISSTTAIVNGRVPVLAGITDSSPEESLSLAAFAKDVGVTAVVAAPPFYFQLSQPELETYYKRLADELTLPLYLYNMPALTKLVIEPATVARLARHGNVAGLKDSSANASYYNTLLELLKEEQGFSLFVGPDEMLASTVLSGGSGGVNSGANMFPELYVALYQAATAFDREKCRELQSHVMNISVQLYNSIPAGTSYLKGIKACLKAMEICSDRLCSPLFPYNEQESKVIKQNFEQFKKQLKW